MVEPVAEAKPQLEKEEYKDLGEYVATITPVEV